MKLSNEKLIIAFVLGMCFSVIFIFGIISIYNEKIQITCISRVKDIFYNNWTCPNDPNQDLSIKNGVELEPIGIYDPQYLIENINITL